MAELFAVSNIRSAKDGKRNDFKTGDKVTGFDKETLAEWKRQGIVASKSKLRVLRPELFNDDLEEEEVEEEPTPKQAETPQGGQQASGAPSTGTKES